MEDQQTASTEPAVGKLPSAFEDERKKKKEEK
jgi:hypothetical protein